MKFPQNPRKGEPVKRDWLELLGFVKANRIRSVIGGELKGSPNGKILVIDQPVTPKPNPILKEPLRVTLRPITSNPETYEVYAEYGHVVPRHNGSADTGAPIEITSLPTNDTPLGVVEDDKLWVKLTIAGTGKCTAALWEKGAAWPTDTPPSLAGGDSASGTEGTRHIRIAEIIANPDSTLTPVPLIREQLHTGHIDHFQPELVENTISSASGNQGRVLKQWNASAGRWDLRYIEAEDGVEITEEADRIVIRATGGHPWKATENGTAFISIAPGELLAARLSTGGVYPFYWEELSYAGGDIEVTAATGYILISMVASEEDAGSTNAGDSGILSTPASFTVEFKATLPSVTGDMAFPICKVALAAGVATVTKQILTHNPSPSITWISPAP